VKSAESQIDNPKGKNNERIRICSRYQPSLQLSIARTQHLGQGFLIEAARIQYADADPIQLVLGSNCNECISFLLVVEYVDAMPGRKWRARS
jgi:hypothetical protein